jgi:hypothetical protein
VDDPSSIRNDIRRLALGHAEGMRRAGVITARAQIANDQIADRQRNEPRDEDRRRAETLKPAMGSGLVKEPNASTTFIV